MTPRRALRSKDAKFTFREIEATETPIGNVPGALAKVARRLADAGVNIEALLPTGMQGNEVTVAFVTSDPGEGPLDPVAGGHHGPLTCDGIGDQGRDRWVPALPSFRGPAAIVHPCAAISAPRTMRRPRAAHVRGPSTSASAAGCMGPRWTAGSGGCRAWRP